MLLKSHKDLAHFETAYGVKLHRVARLAPSQPVFTLTHPEIADKKSNQRYNKLHFELPTDTGSIMVHGFAGYVDAILYKDVHHGIEPSTATPNMFSWFPVFFPLLRPLCVPSESPIEVHFWQCCGATEVSCSFEMGMVRVVCNCSIAFSYPQQQWKVLLGRLVIAGSCSPD